jgi:hypothetical protein
MGDDKKKIIFLDESADETSSALEGGSQFQETSQFPDVPSDNYEISNSSNIVLNSNIETTSEVPVEHTGGNDNLSELSDSPDLTTLNVSPDMSDNVSQYSDDGLISEGGASSVSDISSVRTNDLLSVDPLYIRLTKFLEADIKLDGGSSRKVNVVDVLHDISTSLKDITKSLGELSSYSQKIAVEKMKQ